MSATNSTPMDPDVTESGAAHDPEVAEAYAEAVGVDPTQEEINAYLALAGAEPLDEPPDEP